MKQFANLRLKNQITKYYLKHNLKIIRKETKGIAGKNGEGDSKIDFDSKGTWEEIDCRASAVPEAAVPSENMLFQLDLSRNPHKICSSNTS